MVHTEFLKKTWAFLGFAKNNFWVFLSVPHLVDNYAKIADRRGRNLMCHCTLPSRLVLFAYEWVQKRDHQINGFIRAPVPGCSGSRRSPIFYLGFSVPNISPVAFLAFLVWRYAPFLVHDSKILVISGNKT